MEGPDNPEFLENSLLLFYSFMLGLIFIVGIAENLLVLLVFYRKPGLRTTANRFVMNLMIINIISCLSLLPITLRDGTATIVGNYLCFLEQFTSVFCSSLIVYAVFLISIDQYFAVVDPLHYHCIISSWKGYLMIISSWGFSALLAFLGAFQPDFRVSNHHIFRQYSVISEKSSREIGPNVSLNVSEAQKLKENSYSLYRVVFTASYVTAAFVIPFGLITFIYYQICVAASGNSKRTRTSMIVSEDYTQVLRDKFQSEKIEFHGRSNPSGNNKNSKEQENKISEQLDSSSLLQGDSQEVSNPSLVITRPSPPRPLLSGELKDNNTCTGEKEEAEKICSENKSSKNSRSNVKPESEVPFLKPTLKNNQSFSKLSSLHIQFSNSTEKFNGNPSDRRHSNISLTVLDPEFENITKTRSSSVQSNFCDIPSRSSSSTRSTNSSIHIQSSRSSSLNSTRLPPSRASSIRSTSSYLVQNIRHRISNASLFRYRKEARATRISAMVIVMALLCWLPFFIIFTLHYGICSGRYSHLSYYFDELSVVLLLMSTIISPFLFAYRNRQIKKEIKKIFQHYPKYLKRDYSKSFYRNNLSLDLKFQTVNLFTEVSKKKLKCEEKWTVGVLNREVPFNFFSY